MKAISLWQPWATLVALKLKTIETRNHSRFRALAGKRIAIHAAQKWNQDGLLVSRLLDGRPLGHALPNIMNIDYWAMRCRGKIVCTATVNDTMWAEDAAANRNELECRALCDVEDKFLLFLGDIKPLAKPFPVRGRQGIFTVPDELFADNGPRITPACAFPHADRDTVQL